MADESDRRVTLVRIFENVISFNSADFDAREFSKTRGEGTVWRLRYGDTLGAWWKAFD